MSEPETNSPRPLPPGFTAPVYSPIVGGSPVPQPIDSTQQTPLGTAYHAPLQSSDAASTSRSAPGKPLPPSGRGAAKKKRRRSRGEGGIESLSSGSFRASYVITYQQIEGKQKAVYIRKTFRRRSDAVVWLAEQKLRFGKGEEEVTIPKAYTVAEYAEQWLSLRRVSGIKSSSVGFYAGVIKSLIVPRLGGVLVRKLSKSAVEKWLTDLDKAGVPPDRRRKAVTTLRAICKAAVEDRLIDRSPAHMVKRPRHKPKEIRFWTVEQAAAVVAAARERRLGALFVLALDSGCRVGELQALKWTEVDLDGGLVRIIATLSPQGEPQPPKTPKARRTVQICPGTVAALRAHREAMRAEGRDVDRGIVFPAKKAGGFLAHNTLYQKYAKGLVKAAGVPWIGLHGIRHTSATMLLRSGMWVKAVSERLGHDDIETTLRTYAHCVPGEDDGSAEIVEQMLFAGTQTHRPQNQPTGGVNQSAP